jgi:hypothetical protein
MQFVEVNDIGNTTHAINVDYIVVMVQDTAETYRVFLNGLTQPIHVDKENMQKISKMIGVSG